MKLRLRKRKSTTSADASVEPKRSKYGNKKVEFQGIIFDSKKEKDRYLFLKDAEHKGIIKDLKLQVTFELVPAKKNEYVKHLKTKDKIVSVTLQRPITYTADFSFIRVSDGEYVVEDVKASKFLLTDKYVLKKKMLYAFQDILIKEVYNATDPI